MTRRLADQFVSMSRRKLAVNGWLLRSAAAGASLVTLSAYAANGTWTGASDGAWFNSQNWAGGVVPGSSSSTTNTDTATFNNAGGGNTSVDINSPWDIDAFIFDTNAAPYTFTGSLILGTSGGEIEMTPSVVNSQSFSFPLQLQTLGGNYTLSNDAASSLAVLNYSGQIQGTPQAVTGTGAPPAATLFLSGANTGNNTIRGNISNNGSERIGVTKNGEGTWNLSNPNSYSGITTVNAGTLELSNALIQQTGKFFVNGGTLEVSGNVASAAGATINGGTLLLTGNSGFTSAQTTIVLGGGTLLIDNTAQVYAHQTGGRISLEGGSFNFISGTGGGGGGGNNVSTGNLEDAAGGVINLTANNTSSTVVMASSLSRSSNEGTLFVTGTNLGAAPGPNTTNLITTSAGSFAAPIGGGGAAGTSDVSIEAFAVGQDLARSGNAQYGFMTGVSDANGLRVLNASTEYASSVNATPLANVSLSGPSSINRSSAMANALRIDAGGSLDGSGHLVVNSGAVLGLPGNAGISLAALDFGSQEGMITAIGDLTVSSNIGGTAGLYKNGPGTLTLAAPSTQTYINGFTAIHQGTIRLGADNELPRDTTVLLSGGSLDLNGHNQAVGTVSSNLFNSVSGAVYNAATNPYATLTITGTQTTSFHGTIGGSGGNNLGLAVDTGNQPFWLAQQNTYSGATSVASGALQLDFSQTSSPLSDVLPAGTSLQDAGSMLVRVGKTNASQSFVGVTVEPGATSISETLGSSGGSVQVNLGALSRVVGGALNLRTIAGSGFTSSSANTNGILGGYVTLNSTDWAAVDQVGAVGAASYTNDVWTPGANVTVTTSSTQTNATANSLRFGAAAPATVTLAGTNVLTSGGVLVSSAVGANASVITGGTLEGAAGQDLILQQWNNAAGGNLEVDSVIADNASPTALTVAGSGAVLLTGNNTYTGGTYLNGGTLSIASNANLGAPAAGAPLYLGPGTLAVAGSMSLDNNGSAARQLLVVGGGGTISVPTGQTLTVPGFVRGHAAGTITLGGGGTLLLGDRINSFAGTIFISNGSLELAGADAALYATVDFNGSATGGTSQLLFSAGVGAFSLGGISGGASNSVVANFKDLGNAPVNIAVGFNNQNSTFLGTIGGIVDFTKEGTGTLTMRGIGYSTMVTAGTLLLNGTGSSVTGGASIENNASLVFAGNAVGSTLSGNGITTVYSGFNLESPLINQDGGLVNNGTTTVDGIAGGLFTSAIGGVRGTGVFNIGNSSAGTTVLVLLDNSSGPSSQSALTINTGSTLNLTNTSFDLHYGTNASPDASVRSWLVQGYNAGTWTGTGITSSTAAGDTIHHSVGYADGADNVVAGLAAGDELMKYTFAGDANLDGKVDVSDLGILATNYGKLSGTRWDQGDFTYDGGVDVSDLGVLATNYGAGTGLSGAAAAAQFQSDLKLVESEDPAFARAVGVPEPGTAALVGIGALGLFARRRQRR